MEPVSRPIIQAPRGASSADLATFSSSVVSDLRKLFAKIESLENMLTVAGSREIQESNLQAQLLDGLRRTTQVANVLGANRREIEELATLADVTAPADYAHAYFPTVGMSPFDLLTDNLVKEYISSGSSSFHSNRGGLTLPLRSRRSLVFGNDPATGEVVFPSELAVAFTPTYEPDVRYSEQTDARLALTDDETRPFARNVKLSANNQTQVVHGDLTVIIPPSLGGSLRLNLLEVNPYPNYTTAISNIRLYSPSGALLQVLPGPWAEPVSIPIITSGAGGVGKVVVAVSAASPTFREGHKTFTYGVAKLGLYEATYANSGSFYAYHGTPDSRPVIRFSGMKNNMTFGDQDLIGTGKLRLRIQAPNLDVNEFAYGSSEFNSRWTTIFDTSSAIENFLAPGVSNSWFPPGGIALSSPVQVFRIAGELTTQDSRRPLLSDILVEYEQ